MSELPDLVHQATLDTIERVRREERERIIKLWEQEMKCGCESAMQHLIQLIKGENE